MSETIKIPESSQPWYAGVAAGASIAERVEALKATPAERVNFFWLSVGVAFKESFPDGTSEDLDLFVAGASLRKPTVPVPAFQFTVDSMDGAAFWPDGVDPNDEDVERTDFVVEVLTWMVAAVARQMADGSYDGPVRDPNGGTVGHFQLSEEI